MNWKDILAPGASRVPWHPEYGPLPAGYIMDTFGTPVGRNDWVEGGQPGTDDDYISGSGDWLGRGRTMRNSPGVPQGSTPIGQASRSMAPQQRSSWIEALISADNRPQDIREALAAYYATGVVSPLIRELGFA